MGEVYRVAVHASHCCLKHGCKYADDDCPVETGRIKQLYDCESCGNESHDTANLAILRDALEYIRKLEADTFPKSTYWCIADNALRKAQGMDSEPQQSTVKRAE